MKLRLTIIFLLIVFLPLVFLGWLGMRVAENERVLVEQRFNELMQGRLRDVDRRIASVLTKREEELLSLSPLSGQSKEQLRALAWNSTTVQQFFVMNENDELRYPVSSELVLEYVARKNNTRPPPADQSAQQATPIQETPVIDLPVTAEEAAFLERTHAIWINKRIPAAKIQEQRIYVKTGKLLGKTEGFSSGFEKGWYVWHWDNGLNLIFWWRDEHSVIVGAELNPIRLMADIIDELPATSMENRQKTYEYIALLDSKGDRIYSWGTYDPKPYHKPTTSIALSAPLSSWRLEYYVPPGFTGAVSSQGILFNLGAGLIVLVLAIMALAIYYYRESSREMREATQRVSFVNQVSHELKTPLTSIRMYAEMLEEKLDEEDEKARNHVGIIVSESQRLSRLIGNVLTFGRQQRSALKLRCTPGDIDAVIHSVAQRFEPALHEKGIKIVVGAGIDKQVRFDPDVLEQILGNLLSNIEKYAVNSNHAEIDSRYENNTVVITVADNGPGIPLKERARVFNAFYRVSNKVNDGVAGAGIGLAIARDLARLHSGDLTLEPCDQGACFKITIHAPQVFEEGGQQ